MTNHQKERKLIRYIKAPLRFLIKARNMYVQGMAECRGPFTYVDTSTGWPNFSLTTSASRSSASDQDFKVVRAANSHRSQNGNNRVDQFGAKMPRSHSVAIGRIDEDKPCDFGDVVQIKSHAYPRSKSCAVRGGGGVLF